MDRADLTGLTWRKSTRSGGDGGDCVEAAKTPLRMVAVRDSKNPTGPTLVFTTAEWRMFLQGVQSG
jgi:hypothetical protein